MIAALDWMDSAACVDSGVDFFAEHGIDYGPARKVCSRCPVRMDCLEHALATESAFDRHGIRGGCSPLERKRLAAERARW